MLKQFISDSVAQEGSINYMIWIVCRCHNRSSHNMKYILSCVIEFLSNTVAHDRNPSVSTMSNLKQNVKKQLSLNKNADKL